MKSRSSKNTRSCRKGITLIEVLACVAVFGFMVAMAGPLMFDFRKADKQLKRAMEHVREMDWLSRTFRGDLAKARELAPRHGIFKLGEETLILRALPVGTPRVGAESRAQETVYTYRKDSGELFRFAYNVGPDRERATARVMVRDLEKVEFLYGPEDTSGRRSVELRMAFKKGLVHKNKAVSYDLFGIVGE